MIDLTQIQELVVQQRVEWLEAITDFESKNRYAILAPDGEELLYAYEESGGFQRMFLKSNRSLELHVVDPSGADILTLSRDRFFFRPSLHVSDGDGRNLGALDKRWGLLTRKFDMTNSTGGGMGSIRGHVTRPYTFFVRNPQDAEIAQITKQWSGFGREMFTDADTLHIDFGSAQGQDFRLLLLAAVFALDLTFFES